jgi:hypothetical protein
MKRLDLSTYLLLFYDLFIANSKGAVEEVLANNAGRNKSSVVNEPLFGMCSIEPLVKKSGNPKNHSTKRTLSLYRYSLLPFLFPIPR